MLGKWSLIETHESAMHEQVEPCAHFAVVTMSQVIHSWCFEVTLLRDRVPTWHSLLTLSV
jgi:hypothetical protein